MSNEAALKNIMNQMYEETVEEVKDFLTTAGLLIERDTKKNFKAWTQYGTGATEATIVSIITEENGEMVCKIGSPSKVFKFREEGTSPHRSSTGSDEFVESVTKWGKRQGMTDEEIDSVIFFIRKHGTKPRPALYPAFYQNKEKILQLAKRMLANG